jgi:3-oxoacyl-[acyl-carrier protein] reductase
MDLGLEGRVALVTAGSKGIGRAIAEGLAAEGARVALTSRSADTADEVAARIDGARGYAFDSDDLDAVPALLDRVQADLERILPGMRERGFGRVVAIGSMSVREPIDVLQLSNAHRTGLVAAFKVLAREYARDNVTLNTIHPGRIATSRLADTSGSLEAAEADARETVPAARLGTPEECAAPAVFLCSVQASYITGTSLLVDGALTRSV